MFFKSRRGDGDSATKDSIDEIIKHHHEMQEKVAEEMIMMAQSMKQTTLRSREIMQKDNQVFINTLIKRRDFGGKKF